MYLPLFFFFLPFAVGSPVGSGVGNVGEPGSPVGGGVGNVGEPGSYVGEGVGKVGAGDWVGGFVEGFVGGLVEAVHCDGEHDLINDSRHHPSVAGVSISKF